MYVRRSFHKKRDLKKKKLFSFLNFFQKCKLWIVWNWFLVKRTANQTECSSLEQRSAIKRLVAEKCKSCVWNWFIVKNYFHLTKTFLLKLFKIVANQTEYSRLEQRFVIDFLVAKKCKPCEICRRICDVYGKMFQSNIYE